MSYVSIMLSVASNKAGLAGSCDHLEAVPEVVKFTFVVKFREKVKNVHCEHSSKQCIFIHVSSDARWFGVYTLSGEWV